MPRNREFIFRPYSVANLAAKFARFRISKFMTLHDLVLVRAVKCSKHLYLYCGMPIAIIMSKGRVPGALAALPGEKFMCDTEGSLMQYAAKSLLAFLFLIGLAAGGSSLALGASAHKVNLPDDQSSYTVDDDDEPEVKARVGRISFIRGDAQVRRLESNEWEKATLNLPIVEGDEIAVGSGSRVEVQFDNYTHIRLDENAYIKVMTLKDEGIALSHSLGTISIRVTSFDKDRSFFEIDAPNTTLAIQRSGTYRIDAGRQGDDEIRVAATDGGEARVYSDNAGFTLKNGRSTRVYIDGPNAGEWETADASRFMDEFDSWSADRDRTIAKRIKDAYYDKYYDNDIYGADDLNDYGDWVYTRDYGYVWRPSNTSLYGYADWSPYRYGHWRWMPPFGWTWVNDEPWGWATYHHGRWVYDNGYWVWSPYGYYRSSRSWWSPALVVINIYNNNVCWYPLGYHHRYYNFNHNYYGGHHNNNGPIRNIAMPTPPGAPVGPPPTTGGIKPIPPDRQPETGGIKPPRIDKIPPTGVVTVEAGSFGTNVKGIKKAPLSLANEVLSKATNNAMPPDLPVYNSVRGNITREIKAEQPKSVTTVSQVKVGAGERIKDAPMDPEFRTTKVFGGRTPVVKSAPSSPVTPGMGGTVDTRKTGAIERPPVVKQAPPSSTYETSPVYTPKVKTEDQAPVKSAPPVRYDPPVKSAPPVRYDPPVKSAPPPRSEPPVKSAPPPRNDPPPVKQSPPSKSEPPVKSAPPSSSKKGKDNSID